MELDPRYTQYPGFAARHLRRATLRRQRQRHGRHDGDDAGRPSSRRRRPPRGRTGSGMRRPHRAPPPREPSATIRRATAVTNALANTGHGAASAGAAVSTSKETMIPLAAVSHYRPGHTPLSVNHQGLFVATTISFNLQPGKSLSEAARRDQCSDRPHQHARCDHTARLPARRSCSSNRWPTSRS